MARADRLGGRHADERLQDRIPAVLTFPDDAEVVADHAIGSTVRVFSITKRADFDASQGI